MESKFLSQSRSSFTTPARSRCIRKPEYSPIIAVLTRPTTNIAGETLKSNVSLVDITQMKSVYNDNLFDRLAINHLSKSIQAATGLRNNKSGYESLVEAARAATQKFDPIKQHELILQALDRAIPGPILAMTRVPQSKFTREYFAAFTTVFFAWLVGPNEVRESELNGRREKNVVHIKKCRFLEGSNCVGMCTNLCKIPTQTFIKESMGMPVNMVPNFDDMSCEMIFGQDPPARTDDPAFKQPCYKLCITKQKHSIKCSS